MHARKQQILDLFGVEVPDELFDVWAWHQGLDDRLKRVFGDDLGMGFTGLCDVLRGRFDGVTLRYPAVLHWRFRLDQPEMFTVMSGDSDGLHWGYWYDAPGELPPVVVANYARDAYEVWSPAPTLWQTIADWIASRIEGRLEYGEHEGVERLIALADTLPTPLSTGPRRVPTFETREGMGIVVPPETWDRDAPASGQSAEALIDAGLPGVALALGKQLWPHDHDRACAILAPAYRALGREPLARVVEAHRRYPGLPRVDILEYRVGDYNDLAEALTEPDQVRKLEVGGEGLTELPDLSSFVHLEELALWGNQLSTLPDSLSGAMSLRRLNLFRNRFERFPDLLATLPALQELILGNNGMSEIGPAIAGCAALRELSLQGNALEALPEAIGALPRLEVLILSSNPLRKLPDDLTGWGRLKRVVLGNTELPEAELERLREAAPETQIFS